MRLARNICIGNLWNGVAATVPIRAGILRVVGYTGAYRLAEAEKIYIRYIGISIWYCRVATGAACVVKYILYNHNCVNTIMVSGYRVNINFIIHYIRRLPDKTFA